MKTFNKYLTVLGLLPFLMVVACSDDEFELPASEPLINGSEAFTTLPGGSLMIEATITDPAGLQSVDLTYGAWSIAESASVTSGATEFAFSTTVNVPETETVSSSHNLVLSATNINDVVKEFTISITLDADVTAPIITDNTPAGIAFLGDGDDATIEIAVTDDMGIATFTIAGSNLSERVDVGANSYTYTRALNIQSEGHYEFAIEVVDDGGNTSTSTVSIPAYNPFEAMYLADVSTDADLVGDLIGVPMLIDTYDNEDSLGKVFVANYYNAVANTEVRLLPSKESFSPLTIGASDGALVVGDDASIGPIVLSEVGYNQIAIDLRDMSYSVQTYEPTDTTYQYTIFMGTGVRVNGESTCTANADGSDGACWWFGSGKTLTADDTNPYLFHAEVELFDYDPDDTENLGFILGANLEGWSDFWRFDQDGNADRTVLNGGFNFLFGPDEFGTYDVTFDTHLNQLIMTPNN